MNTKTTPELTEEQADELVRDMLGVLTTGGTMGQVIGLTSRECEAMYAHGHSLYAQGRYEDAFKVFAQLVAYNHMEARYQMALGSAMQMTGRHEEALTQYVVAAVMMVDDPAPIFHSAECLLKLGRPAEAADSLELVIELCEQEGGHDATKVRAQAMLAALRAKGN